MRRRLLAPALPVVALAAALLARAQDRPPPLRVWTLRLPGTELGLDVRDVDGDGKKDLVVAHTTALGAATRAVSVYAHAPTGPRFQGAPARFVTAPADACAFLAADLDPAPGLEVVFLCPSRVLCVRASGEAVETPGLELFFEYPEPGSLPPWDLARDLDGDGLPELLVPTRDGYTLLGRAPGGGPLVARGRVLVPAETRFGPAFEAQLLNRFLTATSRLRRVVVVDLDADGRLDLVAYRNKGLARFLQRKDGTWPERPDAEAPLAIVREAEGDEARKGDGEGKRDKPGAEAFSNVRLDLEDVDGDGRVDLVATRTLGEIGLFESLRTQQLIFRARRDGTWDEAAPDTLVNLKGISADPVFVDFDGDGRRDLVLSSYRMDLFTNVKRALLESMAIEYRVHLRRPDGDGPLFDDEPSLALDVDVPLASLEKRGGAAPVDLTADLDGDGLRDMVQVRPEGGLRVTFGRRGSSGPALDGGRTLDVAVDRSEPPWVLDLDGDGKSELVLEPFGGATEASRVLRVVGVER